LAQRLNALSAVQSGLIDPAQEQSIAQVVDDIVGAFGAAGLVEVADLPEIVLGEQATRLVALTLGELATNSLKHGALLSGRPVKLSAAAADGTLTLIWREDDGAARTASEAREGSGHRLIARMARAHGGSFGFERSETGCEARLVAPIER